jgi:hypothetical protein
MLGRLICRGVIWQTHYSYIISFAYHITHVLLCVLVVVSYTSNALNNYRFNYQIDCHYRHHVEDVKAKGPLDEDLRVTNLYQMW